jgi:hypothetical protein
VKAGASTVWSAPPALGVVPRDFRSGSARRRRGWSRFWRDRQARASSLRRREQVIFQLREVRAEHSDWILSGERTRVERPLPDGPAGNDPARDVPARLVDRGTFLDLRTIGLAIPRLPIERPGSGLRGFAGRSREHEGQDLADLVLNRGRVILTWAAPGREVDASRRGRNRDCQPALPDEGGPGRRSVVESRRAHGGRARSKTMPSAQSAPSMAGGPRVSGRSVTSPRLGPSDDLKWFVGSVVSRLRKVAEF